MEKKRYKSNQTSFKKGHIPWSKGKTGIKTLAKANKTSFKKGHIPWSKGKKGIHLSPITEFKKGKRSLKWVAVGTKTIRKHGRYLRQFIKVNGIKIGEPSVWIEYAYFIWMKHNGAIPKGYVIHHIDKNTLNNNIENLALLTNKAHASWHELGKVRAD